MMERITTIWNERSPRERWMLSVMIGLLAIVILWLGVARPLAAAQTSARDGLREATERSAAIAMKVKMLRTLPRATSAATALPLDQLAGQSAGEAGLMLERSQPQGNDRIDIAIASVRPAALFSWLAGLEAQGVRVETMSARPAPTAGSVSAQAVLVRGGAR